MSNYIRQIRRNKIKNQIGSNKIREEYHNQYDTIEKIGRRVKKNERIREGNKR